MGIDSPAFLALVVGAAALFHLGANAQWRLAVLLAASFTFVLSFGPFRSLWPVGAYLALTVAGIYVAAWRRTLGLRLVLPVLIAAFLLLKGYGGTDFSRAATTVGISYLLFRAVQVLSDIADESIGPADLRPTTVLLFLTSFLTFSAGPIQRYDEFQGSLAESQRSRLRDMDFSPLCRRLLLGYVKLIVLAPWVQKCWESLPEAALPAPVRLGTMAATFMFWIYLNFSGYMDVMIGAGGVFGFKLPENFNRPDRAANFLDVWNRWHITLSQTLLTYVFNPIVRVLLQRVIPGRTVLAGVLAYAVVFFLIGWWHGPEAKFALSGLLLGLCAVLTKLAQAWSPAFGRRWSEDMRSTVSGALGLGACSLALVPTWPLLTSIAEVRAAFGSLSSVLVALFVAAGFAAIVRISGMVCDHLGANHTAAAIVGRALGHPVALGIAGGLLVVFSWLTTGQFSALVYYQRF